MLSKKWQTFVCSTPTAFNFYGDGFTSALKDEIHFVRRFAPIKQLITYNKIVRLFRFLSSVDALSVLYFIHSTACSESFTADYVASNTGVGEDRVSEILDEFCSVGECNRVTAHLSEGEVNVYECFGDGLLLSLISLAYERMCGRRAYEFNYNGRCKMTGGK